MTAKDKILIAVGIAAAIALFYTGCKYGQNGILKHTGSDTTIHHDTTIIRYYPVPYKVTHDSLIWVKGKPVPYPVHDTLPPIIDVRIESVDSGQILAAYFKTSYYHKEIDTGRVRVVAEDTVSQNRITGKSLRIVSIDTTIKQVTILRPPKNFIAYLSMSTFGNFNNPLYGQSLGVAFKMPSDKVYQVAVVRAGNHRPMAQVSYFAPIKFGKRK